MKLCTVEGCDSRAKAKGYCMKHYVRLRRTGKLTTTKFMGDFWSKVKRGEPNECWPWLGYKRKSGHGLTFHQGTCIHASRKAWILTKGNIPMELCVNHKCDNQVCCNPDHLYLGTREDNMVDYWGAVPAEERGNYDVLPKGVTRFQISEIFAYRRMRTSLKDTAELTGLPLNIVMRVITAKRRAKVKAFKAIVSERRVNRA